MWRRTQFVSDDYTPKVVSTLGDALDNPLVRDKPFLFIITTNLPAMLDEMFKRPGRVFRVFYIPPLDVERKRTVIRQFEDRYGIRLGNEEKSELEKYVEVGDDVRFYFECRAINNDHTHCLNYVKSVIETRKQTQQTPIIA